MKNKQTIFVDALFPQITSLKKVAVRNAAVLFLFSILLWVSAKVQVPFYPVPITFQTMVVFIIGMTCGWRLGLATLVFYYLQGLAGLPVFAGTPEKGIGLAYILGPTGGYLFGFFIAVLWTGFFATSNAYSHFWKTIPLLIVANFIIYLFGASWLAAVSPIGIEKAIQFGVVPFLYGDLLKIVLASLLIVFFFRWKKEKE